jgi:aspartate carbamoyltransferase catalytic subunit
VPRNDGQKIIKEIQIRNQNKMAGLSTRHLLGIKDLNRADIELIFETADTFKSVLNRPIKKVPSLRDVTIANIFFENSTRTKLSFELAQKRLSADVISFSAAQSSVKKGETLRINYCNNNFHCLYRFK